MRPHPWQVNRRQLLTGAGSIAGSASAWCALAADTAALAERVDGRTVVLQDGRLQLPVDIQQRLAANGSRIMPLEGDLVRLWRGEHAALLDNRTTSLLGATHWPAFLLVRGLAAESGRRVRYQRFDAGSGATIWLIA